MALAIRTAKTVSRAQATARAGERAPQLPSLTGLRFLAALLVVCHHIMRHFLPGIFLPIAGSSIPFLSVIHDVLYSGNMAVSFFFVLSGFVLAYAYTSSDGHFRGSPRAYAIARIARLYPIYLFALVVAAGPVLWMHHNWSLSHILTTASVASSLMQTWPQLVGVSLGYAWNGPGWSLSVEAFFYLFFPLIILIVGRLRLGALLLLGLLMYALTLMLPSMLMHTLCTPAMTAAACGDIGATLPLARLPEFIIGLTIGILVVRAPHLCRRGMVIPPGLALVAGAMGIVLFDRYPAIDVSAGVLAPCWVLIILSCASADLRERHGSRRGLCSMLLVSRPIICLGEASYALYLLHWPLWDWLTHALGTPENVLTSLTPGALALAGGYLALCLATSLLSLRFVEEPTRRAIRSLAATQRR